jgi:hypothetical protein
MPNNKDSIVVQGWMINELNLSGNDLLTYALIYGFSKDEQSEYTGSLNYLCEWLKCTRKTAIKSLHYLVDNKLIKKTQVNVNNVIFNKYSVITQVVQKLHWGSVNITQGGSVNSTPNNTNINNTNIIKETCLSFEEFWSIYPIKNSKKDCEIKFAKINESNRLKIKETINTFVAYKPFETYRHPNPLTYINKERWNDEIPNTPNTNSNYTPNTYREL